MLMRGNGTHVPSLLSQTANLVAANRLAMRRESGDVANGTQRVDALRVSGVANFMSKLRSLQESNPERTQEALGVLAKTVQDEAAKADGPTAAQLTRFADKLQQAATTGDTDPLTSQRRAGAVDPATAEGLETYEAYEQAAASETSGAFFDDLSATLERMMANVSPADTQSGAPTATADTARAPARTAPTPPPAGRARVHPSS